MDIANKISKYVTKTMSKIRKQRNGSTSGYERLLEPKDSKLTKVKKFLADSLKRQKSRGKNEKPFKHAKLIDERLFNETYTVKVHYHIKPTTSNKPAENKEYPRDSQQVDVITGRGTLGSGSEAPERLLKTTCRRRICSDREIKTEKQRSSRCRKTDDVDVVKRKRATSCSGGQRRSGYPYLTTDHNSNYRRHGSGSTTNRRTRAMSCCCRGTTCKRRSPVPRSSRCRPIHLDITSNSDARLDTSENSALDKAFMRVDSILFDKRRSIVDVLNIGYIASDGTLVLNEDMPTMCFSTMNSAIISDCTVTNADGIDFLESLLADCNNIASSQLTDGTMNKAYIDGDVEGLSMGCLSVFSDVTLNRGYVDTSVSEVSSGSDEIGHAIKRGCDFV
ncbi:hypothetical protein DPMN_144192 [Dreissena polymorpha]|uniref:Uncharacterized protein n=1 Tax=Dreissena polymorpha TaxID=45954 RepID=A0A9D4JKE2_DREPO|nr:hypothetical protein DPMN_144192 [Dreissena polymorpha]